MFQARLSLEPGQRPADIRLREHFYWTLRVNFCGGDIREDFPDQEIRAKMESLGVLREVSDEEVAPIDDPFWETELGGEILQAHMESVAAQKVSVADIESR